MRSIPAYRKKKCNQSIWLEKARDTKRKRTEEAQGNDFTVGVEEKVKVEGKKRPVKQEVDHVYQMDKVKYTKYLISFK